MDQGKKDLERYQKDDKFAANVTGADDPNHVQKKADVMVEMDRKNRTSL